MSPSRRTAMSTSQWKQAGHQPTRTPLLRRRPFRSLPCATRITTAAPTSSSESARRDIPGSACSTDISTSMREAASCAIPEPIPSWYRRRRQRSSSTDSPRIPDIPRATSPSAPTAVSISTWARRRTAARRRIARRNRPAWIPVRSSERGRACGNTTPTRPTSISPARRATPPAFAMAWASTSPPTASCTQRSMVATSCTTIGRSCSPPRRTRRRIPPRNWCR